VKTVHDRINLGHISRNLSNLNEEFLELNRLYFILLISQLWNITYEKMIEYLGGGQILLNFRFSGTEI
jgi:hypothetical protein